MIQIKCIASLYKYFQIKEDDGMNMIPGEYNKLKAYQNSKLANVIHAKQLAKRLKNDGIIAVSVHPGVVKTDLYKNGLVSAFFLDFFSISSNNDTFVTVQCCDKKHGQILLG